MSLELKTIGHAALLVLKDGQPLLATDPWVIGSVYWRSWWLEKYPTPEEVDLVRRARHLYLTHSHPDHFHWPSLRHLGPRPILHARFPKFESAEFLDKHGYKTRELTPATWYDIGDGVRIASLPVPIDDSILIIDTPKTTIVNLNDSAPRRSLLRFVKRRMLTPGKPVVALKSYAPASVAQSMFRDGERQPIKTKRDYTDTARGMAEALGATHFVPFASQAFFSRRDSRWANEFKVTYEDLREFWGASSVELCQPFVTMNLETREWVSGYTEVNRTLDPEGQSKVAAREAEEAEFTLPGDFDTRLKAYMDEVMLLRVLLRRGVGWKLTTSGGERFYNTRTRQIEPRIPPKFDLVIGLPDKVLYESLQNNVLTDLGITMFVRVDTQVPRPLAYGTFLMFGMHDYGHFADLRSFLRFGFFYAPYVFPALWRLNRLVGRGPAVPTSAAGAPAAGL